MCDEFFITNGKMVYTGIPGVNYLSDDQGKRAILTQETARSKVAWLNKLRPKWCPKFKVSPVAKK